MASASFGSLVLELAANTAKLSGDLGRAAVMAENFSKRASRSLGLVGFGLGGLGITAVVRGIKKVSNELDDLVSFAQALPKTSIALRELREQSDRAKETFAGAADEAANFWTRAKVGALEYLNEVKKIPPASSFVIGGLGPSSPTGGAAPPGTQRQPLGGRGIGVGGLGGSTADAFAVAQENLKTVTDSLRDSEQKRIDTLLEQRQVIEDLITRYPALTEQAQQYLQAIANDLPFQGELPAITVEDWKSATVDLTEAQSNFNDELRESLVQSGLLVQTAGNLKEVIEENAERQKARNDAFNKQVDAQRERITAVTEAIGDGIEGAISRGETSFKGFLRSIISGLLGTALRNAINNLGKQLADAFTTSTGASSGGGFGAFLSGLGHFLGFASGGSFKVGGGGGTDSQLVAFRASPDETVTVSKPGQGSGGAVNLVYNIDARGATTDLARALPGLLQRTRQQAVSDVSELIRRGRYVQ